MSENIAIPSAERSMNQAPWTINKYLEDAPKHYTDDQRLKYAELCVRDYEATLKFNQSESVWSELRVYIMDFVAK